MSIPVDLLDQARTLAKSDPKKPKQANLRRSVSSAYYALFHFLSEEAAKGFIGASHQDKMRRDLARRAIAHARLKEVCGEFLKPTPRKLLQPYWTSSGIAGDRDLKVICEFLIELQELRHAADYDFSAPVTKFMALDACDKASDAMEAWKRLKQNKPETLTLFSMAILLWPGLSGR